MKKVLIILGVLLISGFAFLAYQGAFARIEVVQSTSPGYLVVGVDHTGPYEKIGPAFEQVSEACKEIGLLNTRMMGIYFDNPDSVAKEDLRALAAVVLSIPEDSTLFLSKKGFRTFTIPPGKCLAAEVKTGGMISMIIAAMKAYPALGEAAMKNSNGRTVNHVYEVYEEGYIRFVMQYAD
jgi:DNA gyrase inhibitor GyrI